MYLLSLFLSLSDSDESSGFDRLLDFDRDAKDPLELERLLCLLRSDSDDRSLFEVRLDFDRDSNDPDERSRFDFLLDFDFLEERLLLLLLSDERLRSDLLLDFDRVDLVDLLLSLDDLRFDSFSELDLLVLVLLPSSEESCLDNRFKLNLFPSLDLILLFA